MLKEKLSSYEIILASQSPRRIKFLNELDIQFKSVKLDFDESYPDNLMAEQITDFIADKKASYFSEMLNKNTIVITSDTIVWLNEEAIGKPTGIDIKEQKMTLPLIHVLNTCTAKEKSWLINSIKNHNKDKKRVKEVISFVKTNNGLAYAEQKMLQFQQEALQLLKNYPDSPFKEALILMVNYVIERKI